MVGLQGFEPRMTAPKTVVLPLHHRPLKEDAESRNDRPLVKPSFNKFKSFQIKPPIRIINRKKLSKNFALDHQSMG